MTDTIDKFEKHRDAAHVQRVTQSRADAGVVKPLKWKDYVDDGYRSSLAKSVVGHFEAFQVGTDPARLELNARNKGVYPTLEEAKAAAQADYERRILSTLTTPKPEAVNGEPVALTEPQRALMLKLRDEDGYGPVRNMSASDKRMAYVLKDRGLLMLDGAIASSVTEGNASYNGMTFVLTDAGLAALTSTHASGEQMEVAEQIKGELLWALKKWQHSHTAEELVHTILESPALSKALVTLTAANERAERVELDFQHIAKTKLDALLADGWSINGYSIQKDGRLGLVTTGAFVGWYTNACENSEMDMSKLQAAEALNTTLSEALSVARQHLVTITGGDTSMVPQADQDQIDTALAALPAKQGGHGDADR